MAEEIRAAMHSPDMDGDGVPDRLLQLLNNPAFNLNKDNWKNRRRVLFAVIGTSWISCLAIVVLALFKGVQSVDIPPNTVNLLTTVFWAMNMLAVSLIMAYLGIAQNDTNNFRKSSVEIATKLPQAVTGKADYSAYAYGNYDNAYGSYTPPYAAPPSSQYDVPAPTPVAPDPADGFNIGGPSERKPGIIY